MQPCVVIGCGDQIERDAASVMENKVQVFEMNDCLREESINTLNISRRPSIVSEAKGALNAFPLALSMLGICICIYICIYIQYIAAGRCCVRP